MQVSGTVSSQVAQQCSDHGIIVAGGVSSRALQSLAAACGAPVVTDVFALRDEAMARVFPGLPPRPRARVVLRMGGWISAERATVLPTLTPRGRASGGDGGEPEYGQEVYEYARRPLLMTVSPAERPATPYAAMRLPVTVIIQSPSKVLSEEAARECVVCARA